MPAHLTSFITVIGLQILLAIVALPLALRLIPRNWVYGFRTRATLADEAVWYDVNAYFGRGLLLASVIGLGLVAPLYLLHVLPPVLFFPVALLLTVVPSIPVMALTVQYLKSLNQPN